MPRIESTTGKEVNVQVSPDLSSTELSRGARKLVVGSLRSSSCSLLFEGGTMVSQLLAQYSGMSRAFVRRVL